MRIKRFQKKKPKQQKHKQTQYTYKYKASFTMTNNDRSIVGTSSSSRRHQKDDRCGCSCYNPNGLLVILAAQILMLLAACFSSVAVFDCHFVQVDAEMVDTELVKIFDNFFHNTTVSVTVVDNDNDTTTNSNNNEKRGLGFFFYEGVDGDCTWEHFDDLSDSVSSSEWERRFEDGHDAYMEFLGSDWNAPRALAATAAVSSWCFLVWFLIFSCVSHIQLLRWSIGALVIVLLTIFQGSAFSVFNSDLCDRYGCEFSRSSGFGVAALVFAVFAGLLLFFTQDYPGEEVIMKTNSIASVTEAHPRVDEVYHPNEDLVGVTEIQEVEVMEDFDESLVDMTGKKSTELRVLE